jgi:hypothetical protein
LPLDAAAYAGLPQMDFQSISAEAGPPSAKC